MDSCLHTAFLHVQYWHICQVKSLPRLWTFSRHGWKFFNALSLSVHLFFLRMTPFRTTCKTTQAGRELWEVVFSIRPPRTNWFPVRGSSKDRDNVLWMQLLGRFFWQNSPTGFWCPSVGFWFCWNCVTEKRPYWQNNFDSSQRVATLQQLFATGKMFQSRQALQKNLCNFLRCCLRFNSLNSCFQKRWFRIANSGSAQALGSVPQNVVPWSQHLHLNLQLRASTSSFVIAAKQSISCAFKAFQALWTSRR